MSKHKLTVEQAFARWQKGEPIARLRPLVGQCLRPAFRRLAGSVPAYRKLAAQSRRARKTRKAG